MMLELMIAAGLGSLCLALLLGAALWLLRVRNPHLQRSAWCAVLSAALAMPVLMLLARAQPLELPSVAGAAIVRSTTQAVRWQDSALYLYLAVAMLLLLRHSWALVQAFGLRRRATRLTATWAQALDARTTTQLAAPVSIGSTILLPAHYQQWTEAQLRAVVAHEASHIRRGDFLMMHLAQLHRALFWFNPLAWWFRASSGS
jgi:Zn-dependent protease with chaperone function